MNYKGATKNDIKLATTLLIRRLLSLTQTLEPLPKERHIMIKLFYYPERTPLDYSPPFFDTKPIISQESLLQNEDFLSIGKIITPHHLMSFSFVIISTKN